MFIFKGFSEHAALRVHQPHVLNVLGELSDHSRTYTREKSVYQEHSISQNISLVSFISRSDNTLVELPLAVKNHILTIIKACWERTTSAPLMELDHGDHLNPLIDEFATVATEFRGGPIVSDGTYYMPEWLRWKMLGQPQEVDIQVWFADDAFRRQLPETEIVIVPPFENLDDFFLSGETVEQRLTSMDISEMTEALQQAQGEHPATFIRYLSYEYRDRFNPARRVASYWGVAIYGINGNNLDAIKDALAEYILSNSNRPREDWAEILPDIFRRNEFVFIPNWESYAIPNQILERGIHSSVMTMTEIEALIAQGAPDYPIAHIRTNGVMTGYPYRSLALASIGHQENRDAQVQFTQIFPDWIAVTSGQDWNRMSENTKSWAQRLLETIHQAETYQEYSDIPAGKMKVMRNGLLYLSFTHGLMNYLVFCKSNVSND